MNFPYPAGVNPDDNTSPSLMGWSITMACLSGTVIVLRFLSRYLVRDKKHYLHAEDWLALAALPFAWAMCFISVWGSVHDHFGRHIGASDPVSLRRFLIGLWVFEHCYNFAITLAKLSIIALWWRIFDVKSCHICLIVVGVLEIIWLIACTFTLIFSCVPISGFWDLATPSQCIVQSRFWIGSAVPNIIFDIALLILPNLWIMKLRISKSQKYGLCFVFLLGIFVTICSSLRLWQLVIFDEEASQDLTWSMVGTAVWSLVEGNLTIVCCCLPSMRPLLRLLVHGRLSSGYDRSRNRGVVSRRNPGSNGVWSDKSVPLENISASNTIESPTSVRTPANWPLPTSGAFVTVGYTEQKPAQTFFDDRSRRSSNSPYVDPKLDTLQPVGNSQTWLALGDTPVGGRTPRPVSEIHESERGTSTTSGGVGTISELSHSWDNSVSASELQRH